MTDLLAITDWAALLGVLALAAAGAMYFAGGAEGGAPSDAAGRIRAGALAFLMRQSLVLLVLLAIGFGLVFWAVGLVTGIAFACGGVGSLIVGFCGALVATRSGRRASAAFPDQGQAL